MTTKVKATSGTRSNMNLKPKVSKDLKRILQDAVNDDLIITPPLNDFLINWDGDFDQHVVDRIAKALGEKQRYRGGSWSASSAGKCLRRQEFAFLGMPVMGNTSVQLQGIFLNGRWVHLRWQAVLMQAGILDNIEVTIKKPSQRARCTMDGMGIGLVGRYTGRDFGFELKGRNDWTFNGQTKLGVDAQTRAQVDFEFMMSGLDIFVIINENKNNQNIKEWVFIRDDNRVNDMKAQVKQLNKAIDIQRLHPQLDECRKQNKTGEFYNCPYGTPGGVCASAGTWPTGV